MFINSFMSDETISKIKLRLNNNIRSKQSKDTRLMALNNRMSATDYSACNDFFANCCNCCGPSCNCCPCLSGFFIIVTGWFSGELCDCFDLNGGPVWAPRHIIDDENPITSCHQGGQVPGFQTFGFYDCHPSRKNASLEWGLSCVDGKLYLTVTQNTNLVRSLGGGLSHGIVAQLMIEVEDCDSLAVDEIVPCEVGSGSPDCTCPAGIRIQTFPVFYQQLPAPYPPLPDECLCCRPERCESGDPGCLNPFPNSFTVNITDDCLGSFITALTRVEGPTESGGICWEGLYTTVCEECPSDGRTENYTVEMLLCCTNGAWEFKLTVISPDNCLPFSWTTDPDAAIDGVELMEKGSCDPMSFSSLTGNCTDCEWRTCDNPTTVGGYCVLSFTITE